VCRPARRLVALLGSVLMAGCSFVHSVHQDGGSPTLGRAIEHSESENIWILMGARDDLAGAAMEGLFDQCAGGRVMFVHSRLSTSHYIIMQRTTVHVSGRCVLDAPAPAAHDARLRAPDSAQTLRSAPPGPSETTGPASHRP